RPSINAYMYGNIKALAKITGLVESKYQYAGFSAMYNTKARVIKEQTEKKLWNEKDMFFEVREEKGDTLSNVREEIGFIPWYFNMPDSQYTVAWKYLTDIKTFCAPFGITTADRSHPRFRMHGCCNCEWDGAVWPFATSQTLTAMAN